MSSPTILTDTTEKLAELLTVLIALPDSPPSLYIDLEGKNLGRYGTLSLITLHVHSPNSNLPKPAIYLIDVFKLKDTAFTHSISTPDNVEVTLKTILESPTIPKVIFDVRNDSDALFSHYNIRLQGVQDLQLMELATRTRSKGFLSGLANCISYDLSLPLTELSAWERTKDLGKTWFNGKDGGKCFEERPLRDEVQKYCVNDVVHMPKLYQKYAGKMGADWWEKVKKESEARIAESQGARYDPRGGRHKARGPW